MKTNPGDVTGRLQTPVGDLWKRARNLEQSHQGGTVSFACSHGSLRPLIMTQSTFYPLTFAFASDKEICGQSLSLLEIDNT
ncbi:hypothetical protein TNCT_408881 [Trichonephila clavata]|uniref:Uncharacterized protein n=1 Tax=Trichonephila clavata TaxID=2740835 RepID=A0A8X6FR90_TRICU|nr:hypothetical protein TNCT_408881 [Trichonephila clavata]